MKVKHLGCLSMCISLYLSLNLTAQTCSSNHQLKNPNSKIPIPPSEQNLQSEIANQYYKVSNDGIILEGSIFDNNGNLLFCDVTGRRVMRLTPDKKLQTIVRLEDMSPGGLAFHKDGRLFIAAINMQKGTGAILSINTDGSELQNIIAPDAGFMPNDLVFDDKGGFYFTDFKGISTDPKGGVYYTSPDYSSTRVILPNLAMANGIALSANGKELWITEFGRNLLHRITLSDATTITPTGTAIAYYFTGPAPDSMRSDSEGNLYVAINGQGRILVFNPIGIPIRQILFPEREDGHHLNATSLAIRPGTKDLYAVTSDGNNGKGATIFHSKALGIGVFR